MKNIIVKKHSKVIDIYDDVNHFTCTFQEKYLYNFIARLRDLKDTWERYDYNTSDFEIPTYSGNWIRVDRIDKIIQKLKYTLNIITIDKLKGLTKNEMIKQIEHLDIYILDRLANGS